METSIRGAETRAGHEGEGTAVKGKLIIIPETLLGKVTLMCVVLNLTVIRREGERFQF